MKKMKKKQLIGVILAVLGIVALSFSYYIKGQVEGEMGKVKMFTSPLSRGGEGGKMAGGIIEGRASGEAAGYLQTAQFLMVGGIALLVAGGVMFVLYRKKK